MATIGTLDLIGGAAAVGYSSKAGMMLQCGK
jgi:hypothetical protein